MGAMMTLVLLTAVSASIPDHLCLGYDEEGAKRPCQKVVNVRVWDAPACAECLLFGLARVAPPAWDAADGGACPN